MFNDNNILQFDFSCGQQWYNFIKVIILMVIKAFYEEMNISSKKVNTIFGENKCYYFDFGQIKVGTELN